METVQFGIAILISSSLLAGLALFLINGNYKKDGKR